jgi:hypothetical protein
MPVAVKVLVVVEQEALEQTVPGTYFWQPPAPSHLPSVPHEGAPWSGHLPGGAIAPAGLGEQVPRLLRLQA